MAIVSNDNYKDILAEIASVPRGSSFLIEATIILPDRQIKPYRVVHTDIERDFAQAICDDGVITLSMSMGSYVTDILPNLEEIQIELMYIFTSEIDRDVQYDLKPVVRKYRAYPRLTKDPDLQGLPSIDRDQSLIELEFDITGRVSEVIRMTDVGGTYHNLRPIDLIRVMYYEISRQIEVPVEELPKGTEYVDPDVADTKENLIIPDGLKLLDLPQYLNKYCGGIYNYDIGTYYHERIWYTYPILNTHRYQESKHTIDIYVAPPNHMPGLTRTWKRSSDELKLSIVTTGDFIQKDDREEISLTQGNGIRFGKATELFESWSTVAGNVADTQYADTMAEFVIRNRKSNLQQITRVNPTDNLAHELSKLRTRTGYFILVTWENSRPDLLIPGTPVKFYYQTDSGVKELNATLLNVITHCKQAAPGMSEPRFVSNTAMELYVADSETPIV